MSRVVLTLAVILSVASASPAGPPKFNVDFSVGWGGCYRPMEWTPVEVGIAAKLKAPFDGTVTISAQQDDLMRMTISHQFVLTPDLPLRIPLVTRFAFAADKCAVRISNERGRGQWYHEYRLWDSSSSSRRLTAVGEDDLLIGMVGRRVFGLAQLPNNSVSQKGGTSGQVYLKQKLPRLLPWDWTGYQSLDLLVLYDPDWDLINDQQAQAIAQWVSNGGKLLVVLGGRHLPAKHPIAKLLPVELGKLKRASLDAETVSRWGGSPADGTSVACRPMKPKPGSRIYNTAVFGTEEILFSAGFVGFGRVGVLAFDPSTLKVRRQRDAVKFWTSRFAALLGDSSDSAGQRTISFSEDSGSEDSNDYSYETGLAAKGANAVMEHLLSIKELRPLSIWWVIGLLTLLAVLLGPVDYLVLKRLDRQPMTWITSAVCIAIFTAGAYYGVQALRAGDIQLRVVSVIDGIEGSRAAWSTTYAGLFAPDSDDYQLTNLQPKQWWSGISPVVSSLYAYNQDDFGGRNIYYHQYDGANLPYSMPINIWSMQCLLLESPAGPLPITATLERAGRQVALRITNLSDCPITSGYVRFDGNMVMDFAGVPAKSTRKFTGLARKSDDWDVFSTTGSDDGHYHESEYGSTSFSQARNSAYFARGTLRRSQAIEAYLKHGAAVVCVEYNQPAVSFGVKDRKCRTDHVQLVRLVVFPKEEG